MQELASFVLAGIALTGSPGPANLGLSASAAAFGVRRSLLLSAGILIGVLVVMIMTGAGLAGLVLAQPGLGPAVSLLGAAYMLYLAWRIATAPPLTEADPDDSPPGFVAGLFLGFGNPKTYAAMAALFSGFVLVRDRELADVALKIAVLTGIVLAMNLLWLMIGWALTRAMRTAALARAINVAFAVLLIASVALAFTL
jgi:threonine/homoserine/homoserine lactone efflux protein